MAEAIRVEVETKDAWMQGRNGTVYLQKVVAWSRNLVFIDGVSAKRGIVVNGGIGAIALSEMDALCKGWLEARGFTVGEANKELVAAGNDLE